MSKVIYFTTAADTNRFNDDLKKWSVSPNLSNQNFHNKLIRAIATQDDVEVISIRPINTNFKEKKLAKAEYQENNINWKYPKVSQSRFSKLLFLNHRINEVLCLDNSKAIFVDTLNLSLLKAATTLAKKKHLKVIGICTDNPSNISFTNDYYKKQILKLGRSLDGYIVLTEGINHIYNTQNKPYIQIDGVSEEFNGFSKRLIDGDYIYFGGSLMKEYGVYNLINAFKQLNRDNLKLILCGHHVDLKELHKHIKDEKNIQYLGPISYLDNLSLEKHSLLTINPRPINSKIDDYSIPSKTLECLAIGALNVTVYNKLLYEHYKDQIIWAKSGAVNELLIAMKKALDLDNVTKEKIIQEGKQKVMERTSLPVIGKLIHDFIS